MLSAEYCSQGATGKKIKKNKMIKQISFVILLLVTISIFGQQGNTIWSQNNRIGIGSVDPKFWLDVNAPASFGGDYANFELTDLTSLGGTGQMLILRNHNNTGDIDFISNRGTNSSGGFNFYDYTNSNVLNPLFSSNGSGQFLIGTLTNTANAKLKVFSSQTPLIQLSSTNGDFNLSRNTTEDAVFKNTGNTSHNLLFNLGTPINSTTKSYIKFYDDTHPSTLIISDDGKVGIGTLNPGSCQLAVEGKIGAREVWITASNGTLGGVSTGFPDYVFDANYNLKPLDSLAKYIKTNKHLPNIPSAEEVKKENGFDMGKLNLKLLEKVEEITLYLIQLKKENAILKQQNEATKLAIDKILKNK